MHIACTVVIQDKTTEMLSCSFSQSAELYLHSLIKTFVYRCNALFYTVCMAVFKMHFVCKRCWLFSTVDMPLFTDRFCLQKKESFLFFWKLQIKFFFFNETKM